MLLPVLVFILGACVGSFTNVLVFRLPRSESVVRPGSRCRACMTPLAWYENIPVLSYLALRGRCRTCGARISVQYPLVEVAVGLLFAGNFLLYGPGSGASPAAQLEALARPEWVRAAVFTTLLLAIAITDARTYLIPNELSVGGMALGLALSLLPGGIGPLESLAGALAGGGLLFVVAWVGSIVFRKEAMGGGDIKMLAMIGAFVGFQGAFLTLFLGALLGSLLYGPIALYQRRDQRRRSLAAAGAVREPVHGRGELVTAPPGPNRAHARAVPGRAEESLKPAVPDVGEEASGGPEEEQDRSLVPFGFFLAPAAALTFYLAEDIVRGYLRLVGLDG